MSLGCLNFQLPELGLELTKGRASLGHRNTAAFPALCSLAAGSAGAEEKFCRRKRSPSSWLSPRPLPQLGVPSGTGHPPGQHSAARPARQGEAQPPGVHGSCCGQRQHRGAHVKVQGSGVPAAASLWASLMPASLDGEHTVKLQ